MTDKKTIVVFCRQKKLSLRRIKRHFWRTPARSVSVDGRLADLTDQMTIEENGETRENGKFYHMSSALFAT